ncbi:MAG: hypothetical protein HY791_26775 [Deltaproteobacteria bacterium]|nr:hypothetical protein [Deltaproteobacteria bacterium]
MFGCPSLLVTVLATQGATAVFDIESRSPDVPAAVTKGLSHIYRTRLVAFGRPIIPSDDLERALARASRRACHDTACQLEVGKAVAA